MNVKLPLSAAEGPEESWTSPLFADMAFPEPMLTDPLDKLASVSTLASPDSPECAFPLFAAKEPPVTVPLPADSTTSPPLLALPPTIAILPPVAIVLSPAEISTGPPVLASLLPTPMLIDPARPFGACPEPIFTIPESP